MLFMNNPITNELFIKFNCSSGFLRLATINLPMKVYNSKLLIIEVIPLREAETFEHI